MDWGTVWKADAALGMMTLWNVSSGAEQLHVLCRLCRLANTCGCYAGSGAGPGKFDDSCAVQGLKIENEMESCAYGMLDTNEAVPFIYILALNPQIKM